MMKSTLSGSLGLVAMAAMGAAVGRTIVHQGQPAAVEAPPVTVSTATERPQDGFQRAIDQARELMSALQRANWDRSRVDQRLF